MFFCIIYKIHVTGGLFTETIIYLVKITVGMIHGSVDFAMDPSK